MQPLLALTFPATCQVVIRTIESPKKSFSRYDNLKTAAKKTKAGAEAPWTEDDDVALIELWESFKDADDR